MTSEPKALPSVEVWDIDKIIPYPKNAKLHPPEEVSKLARAIKKFGWTAPIVVDADGVIIAGHGRRLAAIKNGFKRIPVVCRRDLTKGEANALRLADNKVVSLGYDMKMMADELQSLMTAGLDIEDFGFSSIDLKFTEAETTGIDDDVFADDINEAVSEQSAENERKVAGVDAELSPLAKAFGFKQVTVEQSRKIRRFMSGLEEETGETGAEALMTHIDFHVGELT